MDEDVEREAELLRRLNLDNRRIIVRVIPEHDQPPVEVWEAALADRPHGAELPLDVMAELAVALRTGGYPPAYELSTRRTYFEWGASAIGELVILTVATSLLDATSRAAYNALRATVARLAKEARSDRWVESPLSSQEAAERGRWTLVRDFGLTDEEVNELDVVGEERRADGGWIVRYKADDRRYEVELVESDGLVTVVRSSWSHDDG